MCILDYGIIQHNSTKHLINGHPHQNSLFEVMKHPIKFLGYLPLEENGDPLGPSIDVSTAGVLYVSFST